MIRREEKTRPAIIKPSLEGFSFIAVDMLKLYTDLASTTTNEVDDLDPIIVVKLRRAPIAATNDRAIQFHGDSGRWQIELGN